MKILTTASRVALLLLAAATALTRTTDDPERGDVPGWVMITLMNGASTHRVDSPPH